MSKPGRSSFAAPQVGRRAFDYLRAWLAARDAAGPARPVSDGFEAFFTHIFNKWDDGISIHAPDYTIVGANTTMHAWYADGRPLVGRKCFEAYHGRTCACAKCPLELAIRTGLPQVGAVSYEVGGLPRGDQELSVFPIFAEDGGLLCVLEYVRDVTGLDRDARLVESLKRRVQCQEQALREHETALAVVLRQSRNVELRIAEEIALEIDTLIMPLVARLKARITAGEAARELALVEQHLVEISSVHAARLSTALRVLSPREREVADLVRRGRTTKDIAEALRISVKAVDFHRTNIRRKLGRDRSSPRGLQGLLLELEHPSSPPAPPLRSPGVPGGG